jgi:hypothetical protein
VKVPYKALTCAGCVVVALVTGCGIASASPIRMAAPSAAAPDTAERPMSRTTIAISVVDPRPPKLAGYVYVAAPSSLLGIARALDASGMTASVLELGVAEPHHGLVAVMVVARYNAALSRALDTAPQARTLELAARVAAALVGTRTRTVASTAHGHPFRLLVARTIIVGFAYLHGGRPVEILGPSRSPVESVLRAYLAAS